MCRLQKATNFQQPEQKLDSAVEELHRFEFISKLLIISRFGAHVSLPHRYKTSGTVSFLKALPNFPWILEALKAE